MVDEVCQFDVSHCQPRGVESGEYNLHLFIEVEPLRMMVHLLGAECHTRHEAERLVETRENELFVDSIPVRKICPAGPLQGFQKLCPLLTNQLRWYTCIVNNKLLRHEDRD